MSHIFRREDWQTSNLVQGWSTMTSIIDMRSDVKGQNNKVMSSFWCMFVHNWTMRSRRNTRIGRKVAHATADIHLRSKGQRVWSSSCLTLWRKISHIFGTGRPTIFRIGTPMVFDDPRHRHVRWSLDL